MLTNDNAPNMKLVLVDPINPQKENWKTFIAESSAVIQSAQIAYGMVYVQFMEKAQSKANFYTLEGKLIKSLDLPGLGTINGFSGDKNDATAYFGFTSFTYPSSIFKIDMVNLTTSIYFTPKIDFEPKDYLAEQVIYKSKDGTPVSMFIIRRKSIVLNGNNPTLLYGYGGFNISLTPSFSISRLLFLEQGGIIAIPNIRGGGEYGQNWHQAGTKLTKQNTFDDFIAAAQYLIQEKYTSSSKLAIQGGSNGGLLVGACMTQRPDLFKVAIPQVGVLDMLRYHQFTIGWAWKTDYGCSDNKTEFKYLYGYSPLHNVKKGVQYPATLVTTADHDDRVVPAHSFKFIATLQENHIGTNPVLIRIESKAGHGAGKPTTKVIEEATDIWAFIFQNLDFLYLSKEEMKQRFQKE
jgi:prolyl oligopeptidase